MKDLSEKEVKANCYKVLMDCQDYICFQNNPVGQATYKNGNTIKYGVPGSADTYCFAKPNGRFFPIEFKTETGKQRTEQKKWQNAIERIGAVYILAKGENAHLIILSAFYIFEVIPINVFASLFKKHSKTMSSEDEIVSFIPKAIHYSNQIIRVGDNNRAFRVFLEVLLCESLKSLL